MRLPAHPISTVCTSFRHFLLQPLHHLCSEYSIVAVARLGFARETFPLSGDMRESLSETTQELRL